MGNGGIRTFRTYTFLVGLVKKGLTMTYNKEGKRKIHPPRFVSIHSESEPNYFSGPKDFPKRVCDMKENKARPMAVPPSRSHPKLAVICPKMMGRN